MLKNKTKTCEIHVQDVVTDAKNMLFRELKECSIFPTGSLFFCGFSTVSKTNNWPRVEHLVRSSNPGTIWTCILLIKIKYKGILGILA